MQYQLIQQHGFRTWAVILDTGDEVLTCLQEFADAEHLGAAHLTAIGAFRKSVLGYFDWQRKEYKRIPVNEQTEVVSLMGDITLQENQSRLHMHVVLGTANATALGGHLLEAHVRPTLEVIVTETPAHLHRRQDPESGLALIRLGETVDGNQLESTHDNGGN